MKVLYCNTFFYYPVINSEREKKNTSIQLITRKMNVKIKNQWFSAIILTKIKYNY